MSLGYFSYPMPVNEPVLQYAPGSPERTALKQTLTELKKKPVDIPMYIGGKAVRTGKKIAIHPPHEISHTLGFFNRWIIYILHYNRSVPKSWRVHFESNV